MYNKKFENNNLVYSLDMIRLKTYITYSQFSEIDFRFKTCWKNFVKKFYTTGKISEFFYNYIINVDDDKSFWFGFLHNTEKREDGEKEVYNFTIEFNPNKLKDNKIILYILGLTGDWYVKMFHIAIDIPINITDLIVDFSGRREMRIFSCGNDNKTIYLGKGDGRLRVYNKKIESDLKIQGDLTRIEIVREIEDFSIKRIAFFKYDKNFPSIYLNKYLYSLSDYEDKTLFAILYAVQSGFPIKNLTKTYRKKIKNLLEGGHKIKFSDKCCTDCLQQTIYFYFMKNNKVIFN